MVQESMWRARWGKGPGWKSNFQMRQKEIEGKALVFFSQDIFSRIELFDIIKELTQMLSDGGRNCEDCIRAVSWIGK